MDAGRDVVRDFETCALPAEVFHHREHIRVAWTYLRLMDYSAAEQRMSEAIRKFAAFRIDCHGFTVLSGKSDGGLPRLPRLFDLYITAGTRYGFGPVAAHHEKHERYHGNSMSEHSARSLHGAWRAFKADSWVYFNTGIRMDVPCRCVRQPVIAG